jgi:hypothetical protein
MADGGRGGGRGGARKGPGKAASNLSQKVQGQSSENAQAQGQVQPLQNQVPMFPATESQGGGFLQQSGVPQQGMFPYGTARALEYSNGAVATILCSAWYGSDDADASRFWWKCSNGDCQQQ